MIEIIPNWHPIFVHFTVALFSIATGLYALSLLVSNVQLKEQWQIVARWNLWLGMTITVITILTGWYAYNTVAHDGPSHLAMTDHRNWALATVTLYLIVTVLSIIRHRIGKEVSPMLVLLLMVAFSSLGSTAWRGGEVVYRYGLGVLSLPNTGQHEHIGSEHGHETEGASDNYYAKAKKDTSSKLMDESPIIEQIIDESVPSTHHDDSDNHSH